MDITSLVKISLNGNCFMTRTNLFMVDLQTHLKMSHTLIKDMFPELRTAVLRSCASIYSKHPKQQSDHW